ncbi:MAG: hypothetical protein HYS18_06610 [Burkholderiales bacterium]|nr:hypothetical protein [Burkholderiales bacterium]
MHLIRRALLFVCSSIFFLSISGGAYAVTPQSGWWWNPAEGGRGFTIEAQNGNIFFAAYLYDASGRATWYAAGPAAMSGSTFTAPLRTYLNGQTLTGAYRAPSGTVDNGNVSITFSDDSHGTLSWAGGTVPIQRYDIVTNGASVTAPAGTPQAGWWWNPAEGGRGFSIEIQNGTMFLAGYMYDDFGNPIWYASGPTAMASTSNYQGTWQQYGDGQTLTGGYRSASVVNSNVGNVSIYFIGPREATLTLPNGSSVALQRYEFGGGTAAVTPTQGDAYTFDYTFTPAGSTTSNYIFTRHFQSVYSDGAATYTQSFTDPALNSTNASYNSYGGVLNTNSSVNNNGITGTCVYSPGLRGVNAPYYVGKAWNNSATATCNGSSYAFTNKGSITALESLTVPAGTFTAYKEVFTISSTQSGVSTPTTYSTVYTCWRDATLGQRIKCQWTYNSTPYGSSTTTQHSASSITLGNYSASGFAGSTNNVIRFAGSWSVSFSGTESGTCSSLTVTTLGNISGTCTGSLSGTVQATGTVTSTGSTTVVLGTAGNGATFSGQINPYSGSGIWSNTNGGSGTWTATHK